MSPTDRTRTLGSLHRGLAGDGSVRYLAVEARGAADAVQQAHHLGPDAARVAGEGLVAAVLMSAWIKGEERVTLQLQADAPQAAFIGDVDAEGGLRARFSPAGLSLAPGAGLRGLLYAIKADRSKELYRGVSPLEGRSIEAALHAHLNASDQVNTLLRIQVEVEDGRVRRAGGLLLERLPEDPGRPSIDADTFLRLYGGLQDAHLPEVFAEVAFGRLEGQTISPLEDRVLRWRCGCGPITARRILRSLGPEELRSIRDELGTAELTCHFCNAAWAFAGPELEALITEAAAAQA